MRRSTLEVADHCGVTRQYMGRVFKTFTGSSLHKYLTNLRIYHARELLFTTDMPVKDVGQAVGYKDAGLFCKNFQNVVGLSPRAFRKQIRE